MERFSPETRETLKSLAVKLEKLRSNPEFQLSSRDHPDCCDLVFAGGGAKGVAHLGAIWAMEKLGIRFKRLAGNSAGAITAAFMAAGYSSSEFIDELFNVDFKDFRDGFWDKRLPKFALIATISTTFGLYEGDKLQRWLEESLVRKGANTFGRLPRGEAGMLSRLEESDGHRLTVMASDITHSCEVRLPDDLEKDRYGSIRIRSFPVSAAVRMSISVPFFFTPYKLHNSMIVDGAFASNLPLEIFDREDADKVRWPTLGINLTSDPSPGHPTDDLFHFGLAIFDTMRYGQSRMSFMDYPTRISRIIDAPTREVKTLDFEIDQKKKEWLFVNGAKEVYMTLKGCGSRGLKHIWNFDRYIGLRRRWSFPLRGGDYEC